MRGKYIVLFVALLLSLTGQALSQNQWAKDLLAYWSFDEGAGSAVRDYKGEAAGTKHGNTTWLTGTDAKFGSAMRFDSSTKKKEGYVSLPTGGILAAPNSSAVTISAWVRSNVDLSSMRTGYFTSIFNSDPLRSIKDPTANNYILYYDPKSAELRAKFTNSTGEFVRPGVPAAEVPVGKWYHVAAVYDGTNAAMYLNGVRKGVVPFKGQLRNGQISAIGRKGTGDEQYWMGDLDDLAIWKRALSLPEISVLAAGVSSLSQLLGSPSGQTAIGQSSAARPTLYFFYLPTHDPSRAFYDSVIRKSANYETFRQYNIVLVNMQTSQDEVAKYGVFRSPTIIIKKSDGTIAATISGIPEESKFVGEVNRLAR